MWRKKNNTVAEAGCLANIMSDKDNCLLARLPDSLNIPVKLFPSERVKRCKRLIHEQDTRIWRKSASKSARCFMPPDNSWIFDAFKATKSD